MRPLGAAILCVLSVCCAGTQVTLNNRPATQVTLNNRPALSERHASARERAQLGRTSADRRRVRTSLLDCVIEKAPAMQEVSPDGKVFDPTLSDTKARRLRLEVRLENITDRWLLAATCDEGLLIVPSDDSNRNQGPCGTEWIDLPPGSSALVYPVINEPDGLEGVFVRDLRQPWYFHRASWLDIVPDAVRLQLTSSGCIPLAPDWPR